MKRWKFTFEFEVEARTLEETSIPAILLEVIKSPSIVKGSGVFKTQEVERPFLDKFLDAARMNP